MNILVCKAASDRHNLRIPFVLICPSCAVLSEALGIIVSYRKFDSDIVLGEKSVLVWVYYLHFLTGLNYCSHVLLLHVCALMLESNYLLPWELIVTVRVETQYVLLYFIQTWSKNRRCQRNQSNITTQWTYVKINWFYKTLTIKVHDLECHYSEMNLIQTLGLLTLCGTLTWSFVFEYPEKLGNRINLHMLNVYERYTFGIYNHYTYNYICLKYKKYE